MCTPDEGGVTIVELLVTLVLISVLVAIGVGPWAAVAARAKSADVTNGLVHAITAARSVAARNGRGAATICPGDGDECDFEADWNKGWLLFSDLDVNGVRTPLERIHQRWPRPPYPISVSATRWAITFTPDGSLYQVNDVAVMICDTSGKAPPRAVRVWGSGAHILQSPSSCVLP